MNYYSSNKKAVITVGLFILIIIVLPILSYMLLTSSSREVTGSVAVAPLERNEAERVFVKDFSELKGSINGSVQRQIENKLFSHTGNRAPDLYTGIIRQGSYSRVSSGKVTTISFLVDVGPINTTYRVVVSTIGSNSSITVGCAPSEQQLDQTVACEDSEYI